MATFEILMQQVNALHPVNGITPVEILALPEALHVAVRKMLKKTMTLDELAMELGLPVEETRQIGDMLVDKGFLQAELPGESGEVRYKVHFARMRARNIPLDL